MVFAVYNYKRYDNSNKEFWPIQPATVENWCKMINEDYAFCKKINNPYSFIQYCNAVELPAHHPYWELQNLISKYNSIKIKKEKLSQCENDERLFKTQFSALTSPQNVRNEIEKKLKEIINHKLYKYILLCQ